MSTTDTIAAWIVETSPAQIPPQALQAASVSCFDCLGVGLAGSVQPLGRKIVEYVEHCGGTPRSSVLGQRGQTSEPMAALANGTMAHAMDFDNAGGFGHPAAVLFPALAALAESGRMSGRELVEAYVVGCEVGLALYYNGGAEGNVFNQMKKGFHASAVFGRLASAAACARLLELDKDETAMALGIAASSSSGLVHHFGTMTKPLQVGCAARDGVIAAQLAARGWTAGRDVVGDPVGMMKSFFGDTAVRDETLVRPLGTMFLSPLMYSIKRYPMCGIAAPVMESLSRMRQERGWTPPDLEDIEIVVDDPLSECTLYSVPATALEAKFSVGYIAAVAALGREDLLFAQDDAVACDPEVLRFMERIRVRATARGPGGAPSGREMPVRVRLRTGEVLETSTLPSQVEGASTRPLGPEQLTEKFRRNARLALEADRVEELIAQWQSVSEIPDVADAMRLAAHP